jgi:hypothetical protein
MADVKGLRDKIVELALDPHGPSGGKFTPSDLHTRLSRFHNGRPPVARATFYTWFAPGSVPKQAFLECIPAFAKIFKVPEHVLWQAAGVFPPELRAFSALASVARELRRENQDLAKTLAESGLSTIGEALVLDRILLAELDYHVRVWPVVRGESHPLHLHSWIILEPISDPGSKRRPRTVRLERVSADKRRSYIREEVIGEGLWRTLGLKWRDRLPGEFAHLGPAPLFIEVPGEERNRLAPTDAVHEMLAVDRVLVLGAPWSHAELMAALLADALGFGSVDLRYLGFPPEREAQEKERFSRERLAEAPPRYVWAIAQRSDLMARLRPDIVRAAPAHLVVTVTYGQGIAEFVARQWGEHWVRRLAHIREAVGLVQDMARQLADVTDVVRVHVEDADVLIPGAGVNRHHMTDRVRYLSAEVLNLLYGRRMGPAIALWGDRFDDCRVGAEPRARVPAGASWVRWGNLR